MADAGSKLQRWFAELRRRKVLRVAGVYLVAAWLAIQVADAVFEPLGVPAWALKLVIVLAALGFPVACGAFSAAMASRYPAQPFVLSIQPSLSEADDSGVYSIEVEPGTSLIVNYLTVGDVHEDGTRTMFFELNGQPQSVRIADHSVEGDLHKHPKAEPDNPHHVGASMPGKVTRVQVRKGDEVKQGQGLLSLEAMKMEAAVYAPRDATVANVLVETGSVVAAGDLLIVWKVSAQHAQRPRRNV